MKVTNTMNKYKKNIYNGLSKGVFNLEFKSKNLPLQCPPDNATSSDFEEVYRLTETDQPKESDFLDHFEADLFNPRIHKGRECEACALSFYTDTRELKRMQKKYPSMGEKVISVGQITEDCGIHTIKRTHINLWVFEKTNMVDVFTGNIEKEG